MFIRSQRIVIVRNRLPKKTVNEELQWLGDSLGLFNLRDKDKSCFRIFLELIKAAKKGQPQTSDQIAEKLHLSRGTVIHHINKMIESGIIIHQNNKYMMRVDTLTQLVQELRKDLDRAIDDMREIAEDIDRWLEL
ncbi:winged helix-turn-helix transcriptional regulator [Candidatus Woesearchaeota archaeon]|nr:winged helix-turn-helix transcriptional regulator [Candidatus Woesearchaeota archaeon]